MLDDYIFAVQLSNCKFFQKEIEWLGFIVTSTGISSLLHKTKAIKNQPIPKNLKELRSFFGSHINILNSCQIWHLWGIPLCPLLYKESIFHWNLDHVKAFEKIKQEIINLKESTHFGVRRKTRKKNRCIT